MMAPDQLERYREAAAADATGRALQDMLHDLGQRGFEVGHGMSEPLKTAPRVSKGSPSRRATPTESGKRASHVDGTRLRDAASVRQFVVETFDAVRAAE